MKARVFLIVFIAGITILDWLTKTWALALDAGPVSVVPGFFDLTLGFNAGISFGLLAAEGIYGYTVLIALTGTIAAYFATLAWRAGPPSQRYGFGAVVGGALGNLIDRVPDGVVTDFIDLHARAWHFPTFNIADIAISAGVVLLLLSSFMGRQRAEA